MKEVWVYAEFGRYQEKYVTNLLYSDYWGFTHCLHVSHGLCPVTGLRFFKRYFSMLVVMNISYTFLPLFCCFLFCFIITKPQNDKSVKSDLICLLFRILHRIIVIFRWKTLMGKGAPLLSPTSAALLHCCCFILFHQTSLGKGWVALSWKMEEKTHKAFCSLCTKAKGWITQKIEWPQTRIVTVVGYLFLLSSFPSFLPAFRLSKLGYI